MPPHDTLPLRPAGDCFVPVWLGPEDHPWLEALLDEWRRSEGKPTREWHVRATEPLRAPAPERRKRLAIEALDRLSARVAVAEDTRPRALREALFVAAQEARDRGQPASFALVETCTRFQLNEAELLERLYADLPEERPLLLPSPVPEASALTRIINQHIARTLLWSASSVEINLKGRSRPLIRQILLRRLLITLRPLGSGVRVDVSGAFALFRHTTLYGRALASLLPVLRGADGFELFALRMTGERRMRIRIGSGDPIFPPIPEGAEPARFDSRLEERFTRDFLRLAPSFDVIREPEPISVGGAWVFPDFALVHRVTGQRCLLEIVGFWTPAYLSNKLDRLHQSGRKDLLIAIDQKLACGAEELFPSTQLIRFKGRVDAAAVLQRVEAMAARRS